MVGGAAPPPRCRLRDVARAPPLIGRAAVEHNMAAPSPGPSTWPTQVFQSVSAPLSTRLDRCESLCLFGQ